MAGINFEVDSAKIIPQLLNMILDAQASIDALVAIQLKAISQTTGADLEQLAVEH